MRQVTGAAMVVKEESEVVSQFELPIQVLGQPFTWEIHSIKAENDVNNNLRERRYRRTSPKKLCG